MKRCMFIDDSAVIRKVAKRILSGNDMIITEASTGTEALERCVTEMPDIIVVDNLLPDMDFVEVIRRVRMMEGETKPYIMICIAEVDIGAIMRAKRAGAQGYLLKPFNRPQLLQRFRDLEMAA